MFLKLLATILFTSVFFASCGEEFIGPPLEFADVELVVRGTYDGEPFVNNRAYDYNGARVRFSTWHFYVSDLSARLSLDETFALDDVEFIDLALFDGEPAALSGFTVNVGRAPVDTYSGFTFGLGVNSELNGSEPGDYGSNHPLGNPSLFDTNLEGYKFFELIGEVDFNLDGTYDEDIVFTIGFDANYNDGMESTSSLDILPEVTNQIEIDLDLFKLLNGNIQSIDFGVHTATTADSNDAIMTILLSNIGGALTVR